VIGGFNNCTPLEAIRISASVEVVTGFNTLPWDGGVDDGPTNGLMEIVFECGSLLQTIDGFNGCSRLRRIEVPQWVK
jgi:hypothetical protein